MNHQEYPATEVVTLTSDSRTNAYAPKVQFIYLTLLLSFAFLIGLLPFLSLDLVITSPGTLRASTEVNQVKATSSGIVKTVYVKANCKVSKGQLLFEVSSPLLDERETYLKGKLELENKMVQDLVRLIAAAASDQYSVTDIITPYLNQSLVDYATRMQDIEIRYQKIYLDHELNKKLYEGGVIAKTEFENYVFELRKAKSELALQKESQINSWQQDLYGHKKDEAYYENQLAETQRENENLNIKAAVAGTIQNLAGIYSGSSVFPNQDLAQISPSTELIAEVYVSPNDIGLLQEGMDVKIQINSFNYNQWGLVKGKIMEISGDVQLNNDQPAFEVKCSLNADHLTLKNGYRGKLKKGMTLQARFSIAERSLWQLLYDKVDNWVNPYLRH